jgi:hypothetical protein
MQIRLNPAEALDEHLADGWKDGVEIIIDAPAEAVAQ